jgi:hypothetical protein
MAAAGSRTPTKGDREWAATERRRLRGELADWLGIGPEDFFGEDR